MGFLDTIRSALDKREDKLDRQKVLEQASKEATPKRLREGTFEKLKRVGSKQARRLGLTQAGKSLKDAAESGKDSLEKAGRSARRTKSDKNGLSELPSGEPGFVDDGLQDDLFDDNDELFDDDLRL